MMDKIGILISFGFALLVMFVQKMDKKKLKPDLEYKLINRIFFALILLMGAGLYTPFDSWVFEYKEIFCFSLLFFSISPAIVGYFEGLLHGIKKNNDSIKPYSKVKEFAKTSLETIYGKTIDTGKYDISGNHVAYALISNLIGTLITILILFVFISRNKEIVHYITINQNDFLFESALTLSYFTAMRHVAAQQISTKENKYHFYLNRRHSILNTIHLTLTFFYIFTGLAYLLAYTLSVQPKFNFAFLLISLIILVFFIIFLTFAIYSKTAQKYYFLDSLLIVRSSLAGVLPFFLIFISVAFDFGPIHIIFMIACLIYYIYAFKTKQAINEKSLLIPLVLFLTFLFSLGSIFFRSFR
ncbi:hypothetical protein [uncultured Vagococcus sp.]|uniref:hypothetical protein n=1 Tax=uncultured Vagococcus sp. TaxID=189676 RepID=UPI0028D85E8C|nr:hypothetical protein [uncultured Vagococcus sp.]